MHGRCDHGGGTEDTDGAASREASRANLAGAPRQGGAVRTIVMIHCRRFGHRSTFTGNIIRSSIYEIVI